MFWLMVGANTVSDRILLVHVGQCDLFMHFMVQ